MRRGRPAYPDVLTPREQEVLALLRQGLTNQEIADRLGISHDGAKYHVAEILSKLGVGSRLEAATWTPTPVRPGWLARIVIPVLGRVTTRTAARAIVGAGLTVIVVLAVGVGIMSARRSADRNEPQSLAPTATTEPAPVDVPGEPPDEPTGPGPVPGGPCPVQQDICDFAVAILAIAEAGDVDAFIAVSEPRTYVCGPPDQIDEMGGLVCNPTPEGEKAREGAGAPEGTRRPAFMEMQGGEGVLATESMFRGAARRWFDSMASASTARDIYGPGEPRIGVVSCVRSATQPAGTCGAEIIRVEITFINPPDLPTDRGTGFPGQRITFHISFHRDSSGALKVDGMGTVAPPNSVLVASPSERSFTFEPGFFEATFYGILSGISAAYPWTP